MIKRELNNNTLNSQVFPAGVAVAGGKLLIYQPKGQTSAKQKRLQLHQTQALGEVLKNKLNKIQIQIRR